MNDEHLENLSPEERSAFESLSEPVAPPPECEDRIVAGLREHGLIRAAAAAPAAKILPFRRRVVAWAPRVGVAAAALAGAFFLGALYGRDSVAPSVPEARLDEPATVEETGGEIFKNADGEMVASARLEAQGFRPDRPLILASSEKPPIERDGGYGPGGFPIALLDGSDPSFSLRRP